MRPSEHWKALTSLAWRRSKGKCERCKEPLKTGSAHLHHLTYVRRGAELPADVQLLCLNCHGAEHPRHKFLPLAVQKDRATYRKRLRFNRRNDPVTDPNVNAKDAAYDSVMQLLANREFAKNRKIRRR